MRGEKNIALGQHTLEGAVPFAARIGFHAAAAGLDIADVDMQRNVQPVGMTLTEVGPLPCRSVQTVVNVNGVEGWCGCRISISRQCVKQRNAIRSTRECYPPARRL